MTPTVPNVSPTGDIWNHLEQLRFELQILTETTGRFHPQSYLRALSEAVVTSTENFTPEQQVRIWNHAKLVAAAAAKVEAYMQETYINKMPTSA